MRFALFTTTFHPTLGGAEKQLDLLARGLLARGHDPLVIAPLVPRKNNALDAPYAVHRFPRLRSKRFGLRWHARFLRALHRANPFDIVHAHGAYPAAYMVHAFAQRHRLPLVIRAHGGDVLPGEPIAGSPWLRPRLKRALAAGSVLIAQNAELAQILGSLSGHPERVVRIPNGINAPPYATPLVPNPHLNDPPFAFTLSTFYPKKGLDLLLHAWALVAQSLPAARLVIAGHGPDGPALLRLRASLGLHALVEFPGDVTGPAKIGRLQACRVYVSSARREPFSNALLEAVAAGCPVVATATGGNIEIVQTTRSGALVPTEDVPALAQALIQAMSAPRPILQESEILARIAPYTADTMLDRYLAALPLPTR